MRGGWFEDSLGILLLRAVLAFLRRLPKSFFLRAPRAIHFAIPVPSFKVSLGYFGVSSSALRERLFFLIVCALADAAPVGPPLAGVSIFQSICPCLSHI